MILLAGQTSRRVKILKISNDLIPLILGKGFHMYEVIKNALPPKARIVDSEYDAAGIVEFLVESEDFEAVQAGDKIPTIEPVLKTHHLIQDAITDSIMLNGTQSSEEQILSTAAESIKERLDARSHL